VPTSSRSFTTVHFDYIEVIQEVPARLLPVRGGPRVVGTVGGSYPWPREKEEVPRWVYLVSDMALRLHGNHAFMALLGGQHGRAVVRLRTGLGTAHVDPETKKLRIECPGSTTRTTTTGARRATRILAQDRHEHAGRRLLSWFNGPCRRSFANGVSLTRRDLHWRRLVSVVPDNEHYEGSTRMLFDEHNILSARKRTHA